MLLASTLPFPNSYHFLIKHGVRISKHAFRLIIVSSVVGCLSFIFINLALLTTQISSLPVFLRVENINLSLQTPDDARVALTNYAHARNLKLSIMGQNYQVSAEKAGITPNINGIMQSIQHPTGWDRIPLFYALHNLHRSIPLQYSVKNRDLTKYLDGIKLPPSQIAVDASVAIPQDITKAAYIVPEKNGHQFTVANIAKQVAQSVMADNHLVVIATPQTLQPKVSSKQLAAVLSRVNSLLDRKLTITNGDTTYKFTAADFRKLVSISTSSDGTPQAVIDHQQVVELLRSRSNLFYKAPTNTKISTLDGQLVSQSQGASGQAINTSASADLIVKALENNQSSQTLAMSTVSPNTTYLRNYTATSVGLLAMIKDFAATHSGTYSAVTIELNGNRSAYYREAVSTVPASTYKLFVAYVALKKIEQGSLSFNSSTSAGSLDSCLHKMILVSDNTCAKAIIGLIGWDETESQIKAAGFSSTNINNYSGGYMSSTASDIARLLLGFYNGSLLSASSTGYLFDLMEHQVYRSGIPAGSAGSTVADKVGFLEAWNHDAAIVYGPHSTYILIIMTTNSSFAQIKELSNQIYNLYNQ